MGICLFYIAFAQYCLWSFGPEAIEQNAYVTVALPPTSIWTYIAKLAYCLTLIFTYPLQASPANNVIESWLTGGMPKSPKRRWIKNASRVMVITLTLFLALVVWDQIGIFLELLGALTCAPLAFSLPAFFHTKIAKTQTQKIIDWSILSVSIFLGIFCTLIAIQELIEGA